jgi:hypothetical protein
LQELLLKEMNSKLLQKPLRRLLPLALGMEDFLMQRLWEGFSRRLLR